jgi:hypothetical protein
MTLEQTHCGLIRRRFTLLEEGVLCQERTLLSSHEYTVPYERISRNAFQVRISSRTAFWFLTVLLGLGCLTFVVSLLDARMDRFPPLAYLIIAIPFAVRFFVSRQHFIGYSCGNRLLLFYRDKPSAEELNSFLGHIQRRRRERLKRSFLTTQAPPVADQLEKLARLQTQGSITEDEYRRLKESIIGKLLLPSGDPGFHVN